MTAATGPAALDAPVAGSELRSVNFFNGRLLTGQDLSREQDAVRAARLALGRAVGRGVACGLFVEQGPAAVGGAPVLRVGSGIALNACGQVLALPVTTDVSLAAAPAGTDARAIGFVDCVPPAGDLATIGQGVFVLTIGPATGFEGRAEVAGLAGDAACAAALTVETVRFRLLRLPIAASTLASPGLARSRLAALLLPDPTDVLAAPAPTPLDQQGRLGDDEVPLALIHWTAAAGLRFVDCWTVRRERHAPDPFGGDLPGLLEPRAAAVAHARVLQFQTQLQEIVDAGGAGALRASDHFTWLPAAGILPAGVVGPTFLTGMTVRQGRGATGAAEPLLVEPARVREFLGEALRYPPITVGAPEAIWLLRPRGLGYLLYGSARIRYPGQPQFDVSRFDQAHYALPAP